MKSIRGRLIAILIASTGVVWLSAVAWIYLSTQAEVERVLDARLMEAARMVNSLLTDRRIEVAAAAGAVSDTPPQFGAGESYRRQLSCQIWSLSGGLLSRSESAPRAELSAARDGFSERSIDGETWRVYAVANEALGIRVLVGDSLAVRDRLVNDVITGLLLPAAVAVPVMALLIWFSVQGGLLPLNRMAGALAARPADDLRPLPARNAPSELRAPLAALNGLFRRVDEARQRERNFTAFAAHELKTPLAGLKTQAQIALASGDAGVQANALRQIVTGVDRTSRLVRQLLDLAAMEAATAGSGPVDHDLGELLAQAVDDVRPVATPREIEIEIEIAGDGPATGPVEPQFLVLALRNVIENAVLHSPEGATAACHVAAGGSGWSIEVADRGPGMAPDEISRATERFFRGSRNESTGSGLGLSIAQVAMSRIGGSLRVENRTGGGLLVSLAGPAPRNGSVPS